MCLDGQITLPIDHTTNITSPLYPNIPRSELGYRCTWLIQLPENSACLIEIIHFEGPSWLTTEFHRTYDDKENILDLFPEGHFDFASKLSPKSILIGNETGVTIQLKEETVFPRRSKEHLFFSNITVLSLDSNCNWNTFLCLNLFIHI